MSGMTFSSLTAARERLVSLMQSVNFGEIRDLRIEDGQPVFQPAPTVIRHVKLGADNGRRPEKDNSDFLLRKQVLELLVELGRFGNGRVIQISVKHGMPMDVLLEERPRDVVKRES